MIKRLLSYITLLLITFVYAYSYNRKFGATLVSVLTVAPVVSFIMLRKATSDVHIDIALSQNTVHKGENVEFKITFTNSSVFPVPFLFLKINCGHMSGLNGDKYVVTLSKSAPAVLEKHCRAEIWGMAPIGVSEMYARDYLGLFKTAIKFNEGESYKIVNVRPALHESLKNDLLMLICNEITVDDKEDETSDKMGFLSQPGYTHRPYAPPDALNRINWKLFAKLDKYMVRENEYIKNQSPVIVLDYVGLCDAGLREQPMAAIFLEERMVEAVLAMLLSMVRQNISCNTYYRYKGVWQEMIICDEDDIAALQDEFSTYQFGAMFDENMIDFPRLPENLTDGGRVMLFTCSPDEILYTQTDGRGIVAVCPDTINVYYGYNDVWFVNDAYDFYSTQ